MPTLFVSLFAYAAAKHAETVKRSWPEWVAFWRANPASSPWLGFRSLAEATARGEETQDYVSGAVLVTKARSKAAGLFLSSGADVWLTLDDDVFVDGGIIHRLLTACRETRAIVSAPCVLRSGSAMNFGVLDHEVTESSAGLLAHATRTGLAAVAMHRDAVLAAAAREPWVEDGGVRYPALFRETLDPIEGSQDVTWTSEDYAFSDKARAVGVPIYLLLDAATDHAGRRSKVLGPEGPGGMLRVLVGDEETAESMG